jgi:hypothetical protein
VYNAFQNIRGSPFYPYDIFTCFIYIEVMLFVIYIHCVFCGIGKQIKKGYCYQIVSLVFAYCLILGDEELCYFTLRIKI